ncbi:hypothetical protein RRG08_007181 [Elysia crispata]|uniref:Uncharacterized protein n=1 Tax=Elysia crispata TaxID=231223 RepID=A0AAE1E915_9GAST|nr:hypothetical protein RRG08_007181 [Elysia crispata]
MIVSKNHETKTNTIKQMSQPHIADMKHQSIPLQYLFSARATCRCSLLRQVTIASQCPVTAIYAVTIKSFSQLLLHAQTSCMPSWPVSSVKSFGEIWVRSRPNTLRRTSDLGR